MVVWLNPPAAQGDFQPLASSMAAALTGLRELLADLDS